MTSVAYSSTLVGPGHASMYPVDVSSDSQYYFVLDAGNYRVLAVSRITHNIAWQIGGIQGNGPGQFGDARALDYDASNNELFVADTPNNRVEVFSFSPSGGFTFLYQFGSKGTGNEQFSQAYGVAVDPVNAWVYVTDGAGRVEKSSLTGTYISQFGSGTLNQPRQVAVAPNSDVFVMNARNRECDIYKSSGTLLTHFGSVGKGNGQFTDDPRGVSVNAGGSLAFATDSGGKRVEAFALTQSGGHYSSAVWAYTIPSGTGTATFVGPRGLTTTSDNHLLLTDEWGFNLHELSFTVGGTPPFTRTLNTNPSSPPVPGVNSPRGVRVAANGTIYIDDYWNQRIEYMNANRSGAVAFGFRGNPNQPSAIDFAWDIAIQPGTGDIFVANRENNQVESFQANGTYIATWGRNGTASGQFTFPQGIAFAPDGTLYVADTGNDRIQRFRVSAGVGTWMATYGHGGTGSTPPPGDLNTPTGIAVARDGTLWVADTLDNRIQRMSTSGAWAAFAAPTGTGQQSFRAPWGVTVAPDANIWVSDTGRNRIVSVSPAGNLIFSATGAALGVPGNQTISPFALAFDTTNHVYLSDVWNNRVLVLTTA